MEKKKVLIVGGSFDGMGGRKSGLIDKIINEANSRNDIDVEAYNGGFIEELHANIIDLCRGNDIVLWMPNVNNDEEKIRDVKKINPKTILISSKRNDDGKYDFAELISRALSMKSNLVIEFSKVADKKFNMMVFDPLGNEFYNGTDIKQMTRALFERAVRLTEFTRCPSICVNSGDTIEVPDEKEFFAFAQNCSDIFHNLVNPSAGTTRFLGNMSFRCQNGFPSFRGENGLVFVSKRNVNKAEICKEAFVPAYLDENENVMYYGENKPSVDTPIQLRLYKKYPRMNYMIHAHCYFSMPPELGDSTSFTYKPIPCGAIEEVEEIEWTIINEIGDENEGPDLIAVNLIGHGCLLMATKVSCFTKLMEYKNSCFVKRPMPENVFETFKKETFARFPFKNPEAHFAHEPLTLEEFSSLVEASDDDVVSMVQDEYCCHGSLFNCWQEPVGVGIWHASRKTVNEDIIECYKQALKDYRDRIFVVKDGTFTYIAIIARDIVKSDFRIYLGKE